MTTLFSVACRAEIDRNIAKYPPEQKQSAVMAALIAAQTELGWVSPAVIEEVAQESHRKRPCTHLL